MVRIKMHLASIFCVALFVGTGTAKVDLARVIEYVPICAQECSMSTLLEAHCAFAEMDTCLCRNATLQKKLAICVIGKCNVTEQYISTKVLQEKICKDVPQESRSDEIVRVSIILASITYPVVFLRFISRWRVAHKIWWDDWSVLLSTFLLIPLIVFPILNASKGFGGHFWNVPPQNIVLLRQAFYATQILYVIILALSKVSMLLLYLRIFLDPGFRRVVKGLLIMCGVHGIVYVCCVVFQCIPIRSIWTLEPAKCLNIKGLVYSGAVLSILEDFVLILLPIWELKKLNLSSGRKVALGFMFALGSFACFTSMIRLRYIAQFGNSIDVSWDNVDVVIWSSTELFTSIICACLICIRPLILKLLPSRFHNSYMSRTLPSTQKSRFDSLRWARTFQLEETADRSCEHSGIDTLVGSHKEEVGKVWVTQSASVESRSISLEDIEKGRDCLTLYYKPKTIVEAEPSNAGS